MRFDHAPFGTIGQVLGGYAFKSSDFAENGHPVVKIGDIHPPNVRLDDCDLIPTDKVQGLDKYQLERGAILMAMTGATIGKVGRIRTDVLAYLNQRVARIRAIEGKSSDEFVYAVVSTKDFRSQVESLGGGSAQPNISASQIESINVPVPPLPVQRRIASMLGTLDAKIELNRQMNQTLEEMAQALYKHWFIDFEPFQEGKFVDSEMGPLPQGWRLKTLTDLIPIEKDNIDPQDHPDEEYAYYSFPAFDDSQMPETEYGRNIKSSKTLVGGRRILVSRLNPRIYRVWSVYDDTTRRGISSTEFIHFVPRRSEQWAFANGFFRSKSFIDQFMSHVSGSTSSHQRVPARALKHLNVIDAPENVLERFERLCGPQWLLMHSNQQENQVLAETRDYLLPKLISGEIQLEAAEGAVEAAAA